MKFKVNPERKRGIGLTNTMYDNWALFVKMEINRMMKCICMCERWSPSNEYLYTFNITFTELNLEINLRVNFTEYKSVHDVITSIIREVKNKCNDKLMS